MIEALIVIALAGILGRINRNPVSVPTDPRGYQQAQTTKDAAQWIVMVPWARRESGREECYAAYHASQRYQPEVSLAPCRIPRGLGLRTLKIMTKGLS